MITRLWTALLLVLAGLSTAAWIVALMHERDIRPARDFVAFFKRQPKAGRVLLAAFFIAFWIFASNKPGNGGGDGGGDGGTNNIQMVIGPGGGFQPMDLPGTVTNNQQQGFQGEIQTPHLKNVIFPIFEHCHAPFKPLSPHLCLSLSLSLTRNLTFFFSFLLCSFLKVFSSLK